MKIEYDKEADAVYVYLSEKQQKIASSREIEAGVILDLNTKRKLLGIEILDVSKRFKEADLFQFAVKQIDHTKVAV